MGRTKILTVDPEADGKNTIRFHRHMLDDEVIASATAKLQKRSSTKPEDYDDVTGLTVTAVVVDAYEDDGETLIATDQAVQVKYEDSDADIETPARGDGYRWLVTATITGRDVPLVAKNPTRIRP